MKMKEAHMTKKESKKALHDAVVELEAAREAARLKLHLFSMDAKRTFEDLEDRAKELQNKLTEESEKVAESSAVAARDLARSIRKFVEKHV
jgi:vacuolar-type H+-ATPase subunit H